MSAPHSPRWDTWAVEFWLSGFCTQWTLFNNNAATCSYAGAGGARYLYYPPEAAGDLPSVEEIVKDQTRQMQVCDQNRNFRLSTQFRSALSYGFWFSTLTTHWTRVASALLAALSMLVGTTCTETNWWLISLHGMHTMIINIGPTSRVLKHLSPHEQNLAISGYSWGCDNHGISCR